ncbi:MAG: hypothetical protein ACLQGU_05740 [bacterium]
MKKDYMRVPYKSYLLSTFILFVIIGSIVSYSYGEEQEEKRTSWGFSILGGTGDVFYSKTHIREYGFLPRITLPLCKDWKYWDLEFEGNFFYYDIPKLHNVYFLGLSQNTVFKPVQERWGSLFLLIGGGFGYDSAGKRLYRGGSEAPLLGDQHFSGFVNVGAGMLFNIGRETALRVEYRLYHISEPFDTSDRGLNTHTVLFGISFK